MRHPDTAASNQLLINLAVLINKPTGITTYAANLFPHLQSLNPTLLVAPLVAQNLDHYTCYPVPPNLTPAHGTKGHLRRLLWTQLQLPQIYKNLQSRLLFSPIPEAPLYSNCRYIVTVHDLIPLRFPRLSPLTPYHRYYIPQVLAGAQHILCNSTATAQDITKFFHIPASKITPILLAHDASHFRLDLLGDAWGQGNPPSHPYFLYVGRHDPHKNLPRLLAAFAALPKHHECELWLAGSTDLRYTPKLKAIADQQGIADRVKFLQYIPYSQLPTLINRAIALVFPSLWEGFGLPVLEAMACGTPVITSNISSLPEVAGDAALLVNPYSTQEITTAMQAIATDSGLRSHLRTLGLTRANQFSWAETGEATVEVLSGYL